MKNPESEKLIESLDDLPMVERERPKDVELSEPGMVDDEMKGNTQIPIDQGINGVKNLIEELRRHNFHVINAEKIAKEICECCTLCRRVKKAPVVKRGHLPEQKVLETITMDFFEMNGQDFLLIVDLGSRYTEAYPIKTQSSRQVIDLVTKWGERLTDNGTSFKSVEFRSFCEEKGINNLYTPVYSPQSNGLAEGYVGLFKENLKLLYLGKEKPESLELVCAKIAGKIDLGRNTNQLSGEKYIPRDKIFLNKERLLEITPEIK